MPEVLCEPELMTIKAGILARTPADHRLRVAVVGQTEDEARERFAEALDRWMKLDALTQERLEAENGYG